MEANMATSTSWPSRRDFLRLAGAGALALSAADVLAACGAGAQSTSKAAVGPLRIGEIKPLTGSLSAAYAPSYGPFEMAVQEINQAGGILGSQIDVKVFDDESKPANEASVAQAVADDSRPFAWGPVGSSAYVASLEITSRHKIIQTGHSEDPNLCAPAKYPGSFVPGRKVDKAAGIFVDYLVKTVGAKRIALMVENTDYGAQGANFVKAELSKRSLEPAISLTYDQNSASMGAFVTQLKNAKVDALVLWSTLIGDNVKVYTAMQDQQFSPVVACSSAFVPVLATALPKDRIDKTLLSKFHLVTLKATTYAPGSPPPQKFMDKVQQIFTQFKTPDSGKSALALSMADYDLMYVFKAAVEKAESLDFAKVKTALEQTHYKGVTGTMTFTSKDHTGYALDEYALAQATDLTDPDSKGFLALRV
jgi:branched-chain amino acid transport system substrate-binding protein